MFWVKNQIRFVLILWLAAACASLATASEKEPVYIFAAASMIDALSEITEEYNRTAEQKIIPSFAGSSVLARQIASGAPADIFLSANSRWMAYLIDQGIIDAAKTVTLVSNQLVLIAPADTLQAQAISGKLPLARLIGDGYLAIGDPDHVPAGIYARQALTHLGLWRGIAGRSARLPNVRQVLALAQSGEVPLAIVYLSDARASRNIDIIGRFPKGSYGPVRYRLGLTKQSSAGAGRFYRYLQTARAGSVFLRHGFIAPE